MKKILLLMLPVMLLLFFDSCEKDPCSTVVCYNGGVCVSGSCDCPPGYSGDDCSTEKIPKSMTVKKIEVNNYPVVKSDGSSWDAADGADIFLVINQGISSSFVGAIGSAVVYDDATGQALYFDEFSSPVIIPNLSSRWSFALWDSDGSSSDEFMTGEIFKPIEKASGFPTSFVLSNSSFSATVYVTWEFI